VLFAVVLLSSSVLGNYASSMSSDELFVKLKQDADHQFISSHNQDACKNVPPPTNGRVSNVGKSSADVIFDWNDTEGECGNVTGFQVALYQKDGSRLKGLTTAGHSNLRGVVYENLERGEEYYVHVQAFVIDGSRRSANLTIVFKTDQVGVEDGGLISKLISSNNDPQVPERHCDKLEAIFGVQVSGVTSSSATVSFNWKSVDGNCRAFVRTLLRYGGSSKRNIGVSISYTHHFRGHIYSNLSSNTTYAEVTRVFANRVQSFTVTQPFRTLILLK